MRGKLIVIDGSDGSGKTTQIRLLAQRLKDEGQKVKSLSFPRYETFFGKLIVQYLNGEYGSLEEVHPKIASLLYALDRHDAAGQIKAWLDTGNHVVLDRYIQSNMAYQGAKVEKNQDVFLKWIEELEYKKLGVVIPDVTLFLHVPVDISVRLMAERPDKSYLKDKKQDIHESDIDFQKKVVEMYLKLSKKLNNWHKIECARNGDLLSVSEVALLVWKQVSTHL